ncbi:protein-tyrosine phosphatase-like protein, partial [Cyathus striatus]
ITHILSICPDFPSTGANQNHLTIPINDIEYDDLLIHLPRACEFIRKAIEDDHGRVLVHCVMGISRSATVVVAYREPLSPLFHMRVLTMGWMS